MRYVNDSKATNVAACRRGARRVRRAAPRLILGGRGKGESYGLPGGRDRAERPRASTSIGESAGEIGTTLGRSATTPAGDLETAVRAQPALREPGDVVLLSPACASFDQFENFEQRGEEFRRLVQELTSWGETGQLESHILVLVTLALTAFGLVMVYSATSARAAVGDGEPMLLPQARRRSSPCSGSSLWWSPRVSPTPPGAARADAACLSASVAAGWRCSSSAHR